eukprot:CAMPEP_0174265634 /NCGR_PEP_ID=MMETSP0439-20130205/27260_1 /TAXON_ID=0 /ORGANISM="Stereomyxa ramosa, Strain Chinc5" /LENGTH=739 /DNA_ID=CAMNT_0015352191 /DNA_START=14 /DNA_END=2230 /DNA_ORIENTATION=+
MKKVEDHSSEDSDYLDPHLLTHMRTSWPPHNVMKSPRASSTSFYHGYLPPHMRMPTPKESPSSWGVSGKKLKKTQKIELDGKKKSREEPQNNKVRRTKVKNKAKVRKPESDEWTKNKGNKSSKRPRNRSEARSEDYVQNRKSQIPAPLKPSSSEDTIIKLNMGGKKFVTTKGTLTRVPNSYFSVMLSGKFPALKDDEGAFFIDRDGEYFAPILSFLRTNVFVVPPGMSREAVFCEMEFYGMGELCSYIVSTQTQCGDKYFLAKLPRPDLLNAEGIPSQRRPHRHSKVTQLCSKFNLVCSAFEDGSVACWKYEGMALGWRLVFLEEEAIPTTDGLVMSATMTTTGQYTNLYLAVYSTSSACVCVWDQLHLDDGVKWGGLRFDMEDIISLKFMVNNCYLVAISSDNCICLFDLREPPERKKVTYMSAPSHVMGMGPGPASPRSPRELSEGEVPVVKKERVMCVSVVDPFSFLAFADGSVCELSQHFDSHTHWEWVVAETWFDVDREVITCLSCVVFTDRHGSNVLLTYGTENGKVRLCSKVVNTRNFKLVYSTTGHHSDTIVQVMISEYHTSGGGLIFSSLSAGGCIRSWRYEYADLPQPHVQCIGSYSASGFVYNNRTLDGVPSQVRDTVSGMLFFERNLQDVEGNDTEGKVEAHVCVLANHDHSITLFDDQSVVFTLKPVDRSHITSCCVVSQDCPTPRPHVQNQFITGHENGTLQVWDLDLAFADQQKIIQMQSLKQK